MSATGLMPDVDIICPECRTRFRVSPTPGNTLFCSCGHHWVYQRPKLRFAEFDRLMAEGGIEAVVEALKKEQEAQ